MANLGSSFTLGTLDAAISPTAVTMQDFTAATRTRPILLIGGVLILALVSVGIIFRRREV